MSLCRLFIDENNENREEEKKDNNQMNIYTPAKTEDFLYIHKRERESVRENMIGTPNHGQFVKGKEKPMHKGQRNRKRQRQHSDIY